MNRFQRLFNQAVSVLTAMRHPTAGLGWFLLNRTSINYAQMVQPEASSIVLACLGWIQRTFSEAPPVLEEWVKERENWEVRARDPILDLLERPNGYYNGITLWKATLADLVLSGSAYWLKVRSRTDNVVELWWAPQSLMEPKSLEAKQGEAPPKFIEYYEYSPVSGQKIPIRVEDVVKFQDGMDPDNPRKGYSRMKSLFREIFTDDEAANMTASLLKNMGIPGVIISPETPITKKETAEQIKADYMARFTGDKKGEPMVMQGKVKVEQFGFSPEQMQLRSLRGIPEERITAVLGVNAAVVGLGAGLATTKVGATLREYREEATESTICPLYRELASELTHQLLPDFRQSTDWRVAFDLSRVRVLQDDEDKRVTRYNNMLASGSITIAEYRRALGIIALPEHEIYLRPTNSRQIPTGTLRIQEGEPPAAA